MTQRVERILLQWGRRPESAEGFAEDQSAQQIARRFNGAADLSRRKGKNDGFIRLTHSRFNGAADLSRRKDLDTTRA